MSHVIGFDTLNEPGSGWIGQRLDERRGLLRGLAWSPLDALAVASGIPRKLPLLEGGERLVNPQGVSIWREGAADPFREAGVWDIAPGGEPLALCPDYFEKFNGQPLDFGRDIMRPFYHRVATTVRAVRDDWLIFAEADPFGGHGLPDDCPERTVNASHWYDLATLVTKRFEPWRTRDLLTGEIHEGREAVTASYEAGLKRVAGFGDRLNGGAPCLIGEFGIPYDLNDAEAYSRWASGDCSPEIWEAHVAALSAMYDALDTLLLSSTQWNYTASNRNDAMVGDGWNQEDLSIWSADQVGVEPDADPSFGARAIQGFCRPYVRAAKGKLLQQSWDGKDLFECSIEIDDKIALATEIFIPSNLTVLEVHCDKEKLVFEQIDRLIFLNNKVSNVAVKISVYLK